MSELDMEKKEAQQATAATDDDDDQRGDKEDEKEEDGGPTMEEELLMQMISDRESRIASMQRKMEDQNVKFQKVTDALTELREQRSKDKQKILKELEALYKRMDEVKLRYQKATESLDMTKSNGQSSSSSSPDVTVPAALHVYHDIMKSVATTPDDSPSSYVLRMQAQLCKAMHSMGMIETQLAILQQRHQPAIPKYLKETMTEMVNDKSQVELKLMNDLVMTDAARRSDEEEQQDRIRKLVQEKEALEQELENQDDDDDTDEDDDDDMDSEEEEERQELLEILEQGREELERMQSENEAQHAKIVELQKKLVILDESTSTPAEEEEEEEGDVAEAATKDDEK